MQIYNDFGRPLAGRSLDDNTSQMPLRIRGVYERKLSVDICNGEIRLTHSDSITPTRVAIIGTRGIPNSYGGFERFVELLVDHPGWGDGKFQFVVYGEEKSCEYNAWTQVQEVPYRKKVNPFLFYAKSAFMASRDCDIVLCCGCGISLFAFWPKWKSRLLFVNPDGCEWRRTKWPWWLRLVVRAMYTPTLLAADRVILDAEALRTDLSKGYQSKSTYIGYQAPEPRCVELSDATRERLAIDRPFVLIIARLEPENNIRPALEALVRLDRQDVDCIVVAPTTTEHYRAELAGFASSRIRFVGGIFDQSVLNELRGSCLAYVHGHSVGGTNPSLLEALATVGGVLVCHDNKYNREVAAGEARYFTGVEQLMEMFTEIFNSGKRRQPIRDARFHPDEIADRYRSLFVEGQKGASGNCVR